MKILFHIYELITELDNGEIVPVGYVTYNLNIKIARKINPDKTIYLRNINLNLIIPTSWVLINDY